MSDNKTPSTASISLTSSTKISSANTRPSSPTSIIRKSFKGAAYMNIAGELEVHAKQELGHAFTLSFSIDNLGGMPAATNKHVKTSDKATDMLRFDLENEKETIRNDRRRVQQADELDEFALGEDIHEILRDQQDALNALATALGKNTPDPGVADA
jgi:bacterioferritin